MRMNDMRKLMKLLEDAESKPKPPRMPRVVTDAMLAQASADGFDTKIWYHGTNRRFASFRQSKGGGVDELGRGIYLTDRIRYANMWAQTGGFVLSCVVRKGKLFDLETAKTDAGMRILYDAFNTYNPGWEYDEFVDHFSKYDVASSIGRVLPSVGYVGAYDARSQIPGQVVIFKAEDVRILARVPGGANISDNHSWESRS